MIIYTPEIDIRILFRKFYCSRCGGRMTKVKTTHMLDKQEKEQYYKELYPHGKPIKLDVCRVYTNFTCNKCQYSNTIDQQIRISKIQKRLKKKILDDWRLTNQIKYLYQKKLVRRKITDFPDKDHEHCEFCWDKFGRGDNMLKEGYCTEDAYNWICDTCFEDFKEMFAWKL